jgi:hypothetical protein
MLDTTYIVDEQTSPAGLFLTILRKSHFAENPSHMPSQISLRLFDEALKLESRETLLIPRDIYKIALGLLQPPALGRYPIQRHNSLLEAILAMPLEKMRMWPRRQP